MERNDRQQRRSAGSLSLSPVVYPAAERPAGNARGENGHRHRRLLTPVSGLDKIERVIRPEKADLQFVECRRIAQVFIRPPEVDKHAVTGMYFSRDFPSELHM